MLIYAKNGPKRAKMAFFGPKMAQKGRKTLYFHIFGGRENRFQYYQVEFRDQNTIFGHNYANLCEKWPQNSPKWPFLVPKWFIMVANHCIFTFLRSRNPVLVI